MPNWCMNQLTIHGPKEDLEDIIEHKFMFEQYFPTPLFKKDILEKKKHEKYDEEVLEKLLKKAHPSETDYWHSWRVREWGVKWDCSLLDDEKNNYDFFEEDNGLCTVYYCFDSPWGPPIQAYEKMSVLYPLCEISLFFIEEGTSFVGYIKFNCSQILKSKSIIYRDFEEIKKIYDDDKEFEGFIHLECVLEHLECDDSNSDNNNSET